MGERLYKIIPIELETQATPNRGDDDHRLTLRIPKHLIAKVDAMRKKRVGTISRNLWILEVIEQATKENNDR